MVRTGAASARPPREATVFPAVRVSSDGGHGFPGGARVSSGGGHGFSGGARMSSGGGHGFPGGARISSGGGHGGTGSAVYPLPEDTVDPPVRATKGEIDVYESRFPERARLCGD